MRLVRLWQPRSGLFWQMVTFNLLSTLCAWALRTLPLTAAAMGVVAALGLLNCAFGMLATSRLWQRPLSVADGRD